MATAVDAAALQEAVGGRKFRVRGTWDRFWRGLLKNPGGLAGLAIVLVLVVIALLANQIAPHDPNQQSIVRRLRAPAWITGNWTYVLGTDQVGRDILSRILFGARISLSISFSVVLMGTTIGVVLGMIAGFRGGWVEVLLMRIVDALLAVPFLVVAIAVIAALGSGLGQLIALLTMFVWGQFARLVRGDVLSTKNKEYVEAARSIGAGSGRIAFLHILPNVLSPVIVLSTFGMAQLIIAESALNFLGLGLPPPTPTWGSILNDGRGYIDSAWWLSVFPGLAITVTVMGVNFLGDALRDIFDPRQRL